MKPQSNSTIFGTARRLVVQKPGIKAFSLVETLVAAAVVSVAVIMVFAVVRNGQNQMMVDKHRRAAREIVNATLESPMFSPENYDSIPAAIADNFPLLDVNVPSRRLYSITPDARAGIPFKKVFIKVRWTEPTLGIKDSVGIEKWVPGIPSPNIAPLATAIIASTTYMGNGTIPQCPPWNAVDGIIGLQFLSDWASTEDTPWIRLTWPQTYYVTKVVLYDRVFLSCRAKNATISFSDGSAAIDLGIPDQGSVTAVFAPKAVTWIQIALKGACLYGFHFVGLSEVEVYE